MSSQRLRVDNVSVTYEIGASGLLNRSQTLTAVDKVSFDLRPGETLGIVGETGCGKSSLGKAIVQLVRPSGGRVIWQGAELQTLDAAALTPYRRDLQIVFQDPLSSLNPRMTVGEIIAEPLRVHAPELSGDQRTERAAAIMTRVGLRPDMAQRYPNEFSGGQCQRISIARAMILEPRVIVCDEPVSALDVSIQAQICNLLRDLQRDTGVALVFISHDLSVVRYMCHRILVMYLGRTMELASRERFFERPLHPYSRALISAVPIPDPDRPFAATDGGLSGELPSPLAPPSGCVFRTRCPLAVPVCISSRPALEQVAEGHEVACHRWRDSG